MSNRKMKLALTVGLLNRKTGEGNTLQLVKRLMNKFRSDVGGFLGMRQLEEQILNRSHTLQSFALDFEHYTLNLDIVNNRTDNTESINRLEFSAPASMIAA
ncbi:MAG: hypothetical protein ACE362_11740 [Phaeodactylibacter xiamenensis]|nr:hypothetical protein [Phaeodactylibacter xiamenensis]MCR9052109.1 hypothetical protein [bacterium]